MAIKLVLFDFDGVLVDSYSCLPSVYQKIASELGVEQESFVRQAIEWEDFHDFLGMYDQFLWWPSFFRLWGKIMDIHRLTALLRLFWQERIKESIPKKEGPEVLKKLKSKGFKLAILAGSDTFPGLKKRRIEEAGFANFFSAFYLLGETVSSRREALQKALEEFNCSPHEIAVVDDKPAALKEVKVFSEKILTIRVSFAGPLKKSWSLQWKADYQVASLKEIPQLLEKILR